MAGEWANRFIGIPGGANQTSETPTGAEQTSEVDDLTTSFLESMNEIKAEFEALKQSHETLFVALQNLLSEVMRQNTESIVGANSQFMHLVVRKLDELEERLSSDDPSFTNVLYSDPDLFNEISQRPIDPNELSVEEEFAAKNKIAEIVTEENPRLLTKGEEGFSPEVIEGYHQWQNKEIKWSDFVKIAGGVKAAGKVKRMLSTDNS